MHLLESIEYFWRQDDIYGIVGSQMFLIYFGEGVSFILFFSILFLVSSWDLLTSSK